MTESQVRGLFNLWNDALATLDSAKVADRYCKNAVLLPTLSDIPRDTRELLIDYFNTLLIKKPRAKILSGHIMIGQGWAQDVGIYEFTLTADGDRYVKARYTFVYAFEDGEWKIAHHHSSKMPEEFLGSYTAHVSATLKNMLMKHGYTTEKK